MQSDSKLTYSGLARRVKQHVTAHRQHLFAVCAPGLESIVLGEIKQLGGAENIAAVEGGVSFEGPFDLVYAANLRLNSAVRILMRIDEFTVRSYPELYDKVSRIAWERYLGFGPTAGVQVTAKKSRLHHAQNIAASTFEAVEQNLRKLGVHIKSRINAPLQIYVRMHDDQCTLSIDSSGEVLYKRGYREAIAKAPLRESTAAALLIACGFQKFPVIADPLCGSGTFVIEAARMLRSIAPGTTRRFAFEAWPSFGEAAWNHAKKMSLRSQTTTVAAKIVGLDLADNALASCRSNADRAGVLADIGIEQADCRSFNEKGAYGTGGLVVANLPYGKRSTTDAPLDELYNQFGKSLKKNCQGWRFGLLTAEGSAERSLGLRSDGVLSFVNGGIPVRFLMGKI